MNNTDLVAYLKANIGQPLSSDVAADIMVLAGQIPTLIAFDVIERIQPEQCGEFTFSRETLEDIIEEMKPLHESHWSETENHRHAIPFNPDYEAFFRYERAGRRRRIHAQEGRASTRQFRALPRQVDAHTEAARYRRYVVHYAGSTQRQGGGKVHCLR